MPVKQMEQPCWKPCAPGEKPGSDGMHWDAADRAAEYAGPGDTVLPYPAPCWAVICDGVPGEPCGETMEDEDAGWTVHLESPADAGSQAEDNGWEVTPDGKVQCRDCLDEAAKTEGEPTP